MNQPTQNSRWIAVLTSLRGDPTIRHGATKAEAEAEIEKIASRVGQAEWETNGYSVSTQEIRW